MTNPAGSPVDGVARRGRTRSRHRLLATATVAGAIAACVGLMIADGVAAERCSSDGLAWNWSTWSCEFRPGVLSLPQGLRRSY